MRHEGTKTLFQYWDRLRDGRKAPRRTDIEPADIKQHLADTYITETDARGEAIFRLAGTRLCAVFGRELKGFAFASLWDLRDQRVVARMMHGSLHQGAVAVMDILGTSGNGRQVSLEMIALPLQGGADGPRALGSIVAMEKPYWLGADPIASLRLESLRSVDPDVEPMFLRNRPAVQVPSLIGEPEAPLVMETPGRGRRVAHLVVLEGGRE